LGRQLRAPFQLRINERGLRLNVSHELAPNESSWGYRTDGAGARLSDAEIVVLGDSFSYGWLVSDENTWVSRLGALSGRRTVNLSVPGYGTSQAAGLYRLHGRASQARLVLLAVCANDITDNLRYRDWRDRVASSGVDYGVYLTRGGPLSFLTRFQIARSLLQRSLLLQQFWRWAYDLQERRRLPHAEENVRGMQILRDDLSGLAEELSSHGRTLVVVLIDVWPRNSHAELKGFLAGRRIPFADIADPVIWRFRSTELRIWGDGHWNEMGHRVVAAEIYRLLRHKGLLTPAARRAE